MSNYEDCVERLLGVRVDRENGEIENGDRVARIAPFPLGIDYERYERAAQEGPRPQRAPYEDHPRRRPARLHQGHPGADARIRADARAAPGDARRGQLRPDRHAREQVTEYQALKRELDELVGRVNGRAGATGRRSATSTAPCPVQSSALYRDAAVALVTPLRDGMNLVAKEFVASQTDDPGALLSRMAGAAETMREALRVNPYNFESVPRRLPRPRCRSTNARPMRALQQGGSTTSDGGSTYS